MKRPDSTPTEQPKSKPEGRAPPDAARGLFLYDTDSAQFHMEAIFFIILAGLAVGLGFILHAQFKYNRGIF